MTYSEAVRWLEGQSRGARPRGPERARALLAALELSEPQTAFVHIVGTNGKGSVAAYLEAAFAERGGAFTSPHLVSLRERVRYRGSQISEREVLEYVRLVRSLELPEKPAFFDMMVGMALSVFAARGLEWAALEAGVGGASDATMAVGGVKVVVLTNVFADHLATFGDLERLARDKALAARPGRPLITAAQGATLEVVSRVAGERNAELYVYDENSPLFALPAQPALPGSFQRTNAALAAAALRLLGFSEKEVARGLQNARLPGRLQRVSSAGLRVYLDGAHNPHAAAALARELPACHLLFGAHRRKDARAMLRELAPKALSVTLTWPAERPLTAATANFIADPLEAFAEVRARAAEKNEPVLVTGSFYLLGRLMRAGLFD